MLLFYNVLAQTSKFCFVLPVISHAVWVIFGFGYWGWKGKMAAFPCGCKLRIWPVGLSVVFRVWQVYWFISMWNSRVAVLRVYEYFMQASLRYDRLLILALSLSSLLTCHTKTLGIHFREKNFSEFSEGLWDVRIYNLLRTPCKT